MARRETILEDSNDLLLDTLCNTFGGILLLSLLLALLTEETKVRIETDSEKKLSEARESLTSEKLAAARELEKELSKAVEAIGSEEFRGLREKRDFLREDLQKTRDESAAIQVILSEFQERADQGLDQQIQEIKSLENAAKAKLQEGLKAEEERLREIEFLTQRKEELAVELRSEKQGERKSLRLPREQGLGSGSLRFQVILRYGEVFPLAFLRNGALVQNKASIQWTDLTPTEEQSEVIRDKGWKMNLPEDKQRLRAEMQAWVTKGSVVELWVYPDSFDEFLALKEMVLELAQTYALGVQSPEKPMIWTSRNGYQPPVQ